MILFCFYAEYSSSEWSFFLRTAVLLHLEFRDCCGFDMENTAVHLYCCSVRLYVMVQSRELVTHKVLNGHG